MLKCIYCKKSEPEVSFKKREHVIPQAFGCFEPDNMVLKCVCDECNQYFGDDVDRALARDSMEAFGRIHIGGIWPRDPAHKQTRTKIRVEDGPHKGMVAKLYKSADGTPEMRTMSQVGIYNKKTSSYDFFILKTIPMKDILLQDYDMTGQVIKFHCDDQEEEGLFIKEFEKRGLKISTSENPEPVREKSKTLMRIELQLDSTLARGISKIIFNYLAYQMSAEYVLDEQFNFIREFIRYGEHSSELDKFFFPNQNYILMEDRWAVRIRLGYPLRNGYLVALNSEHRQVNGRLSFYNLNTYRVILSSTQLILHDLKKCHLFDRSTGKIIRGF